MFRIKVSYQTGDSFGSHDAEEVLIMEWKDLEVAKSNLARIKEHYEMYKLMDDHYYRGTDKEERIKNYQSQDWYRAGKHDREGFFSLFLKLDNGEMYAQSINWCGYFETLHEIEIILPDDCKVTI